MGRRATRVVRRSKPTKGNESPVNHKEETENAKPLDNVEEEEESNNGFFACYLLCSLSPRAKGHTYIGYTVNPKRRIRQHNGEIGSGAWRTKRGRPWEMILCIYGFPTNVSALQFEWAWQHPLESLAVRKVAATFKSLSGIANKIKIAFTMLNLPSWEKLNLTVNFFSTKYMNHVGGCPKLPKHMKVNVGEMDELPCYIDSPLEDINSSFDSDEENYDEDSSSQSQKSEDATSNSVAKDSSPPHSHEVEDDAIFSTMDAMLISPVGRKTAKKIDDEQFVFDLSCSSTEIKTKYDQKNSRTSSRLLGHEVEGDKFLSSIDAISVSPIVGRNKTKFCEEEQFLLDLSFSSAEIKIKDDQKNSRASSPLLGYEVERGTLFSSMDAVSISPFVGGKTAKFCQKNTYEEDVIVLSTPASCFAKRSKSSKVCKDVVDLTDSPLIIQL